MKMRFRSYNLIVLAIVLFIAAIAPEAAADSTTNREYQIKAAFLYNFIKFVEWPEEKISDGNEPIIIGIIGQDQFNDAFDPIKDKTVKGKKVVIKLFKGLEELEESGEKGKVELRKQAEVIKTCHLLFICRSEKGKLKEILNLVKDTSILTVADTLGFLENRGMINFVMEGKKVSFEINVPSAKRAKLKIRSQLLRLAKKVVEEEDSQEANS